MTQSNEINLTEANSGTKIVSNIGATVWVILAWKPSTGYLWQSTETTGASLEEIKHDPEDTTPGAIVNVRFKFKVLSSGFIRLSYARPWAETTPPVKWFEAEIVVN